jgi:hypothetical protein
MEVEVSEIAQPQQVDKEHEDQLQHFQEIKLLIWLDTINKCLIFAGIFNQWRMRTISFVLQCGKWSMTTPDSSSYVMRQSREWRVA